MKKPGLKVILPVVIILPPLIHWLYYSLAQNCDPKGWPSSCALSSLMEPVVIIYYYGLGLDLALFVISFYFFNKKIKSAAILILIAALGFSLFYLLPLFAPVYNYFRGPIVVKDYFYFAQEIPNSVSDKFDSLVSKNQTISLKYCQNTETKHIFMIENQSNINGEIEYYYYDEKGEAISQAGCLDWNPLFHTTVANGIGTMRKDFENLFNLR